MLIYHFQFLSLSFSHPFSLSLFLFCYQPFVKWMPALLNKTSFFLFFLFFFYLPAFVCALISLFFHNILILRSSNNLKRQFMPTWES